MRLVNIITVAATGCLIATAAWAANSSTQEAQEKLSKFEKTGDSVSCVMLRSVRKTEILDDYTMLIETPGAVYLNELSGRCVGLAREGRYVHKASANQMCQGDILQVIDSFGKMRGACSLGSFEKLSPIGQSQ